MEMGFRPSVRPSALSLSTLLSFAQNTTEATTVAAHQLASQFLSNSLCRYPKYQVPGAVALVFHYLIEFSHCLVL